MDYPLPDTQPDRSQIVLRKAITEALEGVLLRIPDLVAKAISKETSRVVTDSDATLAKISEALEGFTLPAPQVTVEPPQVNVAAPQVTVPTEGMEKVVSEAVAAFQKQQSHEEALTALIERMSKDKKLWFNVRLTDGKKFIDKFSESVVVSMGGQNLAKEVTLAAVLARLNQPFETTATLTASGISVTGSAIPGTPFNTFAEDTAVVSTTDTTVVTYTVPAGKTAFVQGFHGSSSAAGRYKLKLGSAVVGMARASAAERDAKANYLDGPISGAAGQVFTVIFYHEELANQQAGINVFGYLT